MKTNTPPPFTVTQAERIVSLSDAEARALPGMLGRIAPAMMAAHGYYAATIGGVKTLYVLVPTYEKRKALRAATLAVGRPRTVYAVSVKQGRFRAERIEYDARGRSTVVPLTDWTTAALAFAKRDEMTAHV